MTLLLPKDIIKEIEKWLFHFRVAEAAERVNIFRTVFYENWKEICSDIRVNTPSYNIVVTNYLGSKIKIYLITRL